MDNSIDEIPRVRQMPSDREAEESVIGSMIIDRDAVLTSMEALVSDDFYFNENRVLFDAVLSLYRSGTEIDPVTLQSALQSKDLSEEYANTEYINRLVAKVPTTVNIKDYCTIVKEKSMLRTIIKMNQKIETDCFNQKESIDAILEDTEKNLSDLVRMRGVSDEIPISRTVVEVLDKIQAASETSGNVTGIPTGFIDLDYQTAGFQPSDLILIAARPSMGKTALALNIAEHVAFREKMTTLVFSAEMARDQLVERLLSMETGINMHNLRTGNLKDSDWDTIMQGAGVISNSNLIIDDTAGISVPELRSKCRKYKNERDVKLIVIDYLQQMTVGRRIDSLQQATAEISRSLKGIARELNVPVVVLSQLNREVERRDDKRPMLSDLRDSGAIEQDADVVMFIYRDDYYHKEDSPEPGISEIIIAKQRNGPIGTVKLAWLPQYTRFANAELKGENRRTKDAAGKNE